MSEQNDAPSDANGGNDFLDYVKYAAAAIAGSWGLMEILLVTDPFWGVQLKHGWFLTLVAIVLAIGLWVHKKNRVYALVVGVACIAGVALAVYSGLDPETLAAQISEGRYFSSSLPKEFPFFLILAALLGVATFAFVSLITGVGRLWLRAHLSAPIIWALIFFAGFALLISQGRSRDIDVADVALSELREAGMTYDLGGIQSALFFQNERGVKLYRQAGFQSDDILLALGRTSEDFSIQDPLVFAILERAEQDAEKRARRGVESWNSRAEGFAAMMKTALRPVDVGAEEDGLDGDGFDETFLRYARSGDPCDQRDLPLMSYVVGDGASTVAASLWRPGSDADSLGAPFLYGAEIVDSGLDVAAAASSSDEVDDDDEIDRARQCVEQPFSIAQAHLHAVVDPLFGLMTARKVVDDPVLPDIVDRDSFCHVAIGMKLRGVRPMPFVAERLKDALALGPGMESEATSEAQAEHWRACLAYLEGSDESTDLEVPSVYATESLAGYAVRRDAQNSCTAEPLALGVARDGVSRYQPISGDRREIWFAGITGESREDGSPIYGALQLRQAPGSSDAFRLIYGPEGALRATDWSAVDAMGAGAAGDLLVSASDSQLLVLEPKSALVAGAEFDAFFAPPGDRMLLEPAPNAPSEPVAEGEDGEEGDTGPLLGPAEVWTAEGVSTGKGPVSYGIAVKERSGLNLQFGRASSDLCVEVRSITQDAAGVSTAELVASRYLRENAPGRLNVDYVRPDEELALFVWPAAATADASVSVEVAATPPRIELECFPTLAEAEQADAPGWTVDASHEGMLENGAAEMFCPIDGLEASQVSLTMTGLNADLDIEVLRESEPGLYPDSMASSVAGGNEDEFIDGIFLPGRHYLRVYNASDAPSPYRVAITGVAEAPNFDDAVGPNTVQTAVDLGEIIQGAPPVTVQDALYVTADSVEDYYSFIVTEESFLDVYMTSLLADVDIEILGEDGFSVLASSLAGGNEDENARAPVGPGRYYIRVYPAFDRGVSPYEVGVSATELRQHSFGPLAPDMSQAYQDVLSGSNAEYYFTFTMPEDGGVRVTLNNLQADADITLERMDGEQLNSGSNGGNSPESMESLLTPGDYRIVVRLYDTAATTPFNREVLRIL